MGEPILSLPEIPVDREKVIKGSREHEYRLSINQANELMDATFVSMGNPHAVIYTDNAGKIDLRNGRADGGEPQGFSAAGQCALGANSFP